MKLTIEMHHPHHPEYRSGRSTSMIMRGEKACGFGTDMSIFSNHPHELWVKALDAVAWECAGIRDRQAQP